MSVSTFLNSAGASGSGKAASKKSAKGGRSMSMSKKRKGKGKAVAIIPAHIGRGGRKPKAKGAGATASPGELSKLSDSPTGKGFHKSRTRPHNFFRRNGAGVYLGRPRNDGRIDIRRLGGVGHALGLKDLEKYVKPVMLIAAGALGGAAIDGLFISKFINEKNCGRYPEAIKLAIALAIGFTVARFTKAEEAKLIAVGLTGQQVIEYVRALTRNTKIGDILGAGRSDAAAVGSTGGVARALSLNGAARVPLGGVSRMSLGGVSRMNLGGVSKIGGAAPAEPEGSEFPV